MVEILRILRNKGTELVISGYILLLRMDSIFNIHFLRIVKGLAFLSTFGENDWNFENLGKGSNEPGTQTFYPEMVKMDEILTVSRMEC